MEDDHMNIGVVVRVRPLLPRELTPNPSPSLIEMPPQDKGKVILHGKPGQLKLWKSSGSDSESCNKVFSFDDAVWSFNQGDDHYKDNKSFYQTVGPKLIDHYFQGYNVCLLAYGQTGSGKTFTMMGDESKITTDVTNDPDGGFIPMLVKHILAYKTRLIADKVNCELKFSYMEVYNETVRDLLDGGHHHGKKWKVREHPDTGPYVEGLKQHIIEDYQDFQTLISLGNKHRSTASTSMNDRSSRSHAIINLNLVQTKFDQHSDDKDSIGKADSEIISNIKLVDLAGSERLLKTQVFGQQDRIKEGSLINKSLTVLGRCINILSKNTIHNTNDMIPYRDSLLTYILKENLGGNSKTVMIFCVAPLDYDESLQTLNYATRVKQIKTKAKANQAKSLTNTKMDWHELHQQDQSLVDILKQEINQLNDKLKNYQEISCHDTDNLSKMITYLDKQLAESKFQNKYLTTRVKHIEEEKLELTNHNQYLNNLLIDSLLREFELKATHQSTMVGKQLHALTTQIAQHQQDLDIFINDFNPNNVY